MATLVWPVGVLPPGEIAFDIAPRSLRAPPSVSGVQQVISADAGIWHARYGEMRIHDETKVLTWRAIDARLGGRETPLLVPLTVKSRPAPARSFQPVPSGQEGLFAGVPYSDGATFSDGSLFQGQVNDVTLAAAVALRATSATFTIGNAGTLQPGHHFSLGERLYRIKTVAYASASSASVTFTPPAREAVAAGVRVEIDAPVCRMRLASDTEMALPLSYGRWAFPSVNFVEDV